MKVTCQYCQNIFNDTLEKCPNCGAPNALVRRSSNGQPLTIEELKQWYNDRGLPPYDVTRFFIGENYTSSKAFGIYKDDNTGNFVVYKNKASGERAVRYEGTDEAFAVNELLTRLKQEILQQKANNASNNKSPRDSGKGASWGKRRLKGLFALLILGAIFPFTFFLGSGIISFFSEPKLGYYSFEEQVYYNDAETYFGSSWYKYDGDKAQWVNFINDDGLPSVFFERSLANGYFVSDVWNGNIGCTDFKTSVYKSDLELGLYSNEGYYALNDLYYFHLDGKCYADWFVYDGGWKALALDDIPYELKHSSLNKELYLTKEHIAQYPCQDFSETIDYKDFYAAKEEKKGYFYVDDRVYYHNDSLYYLGWYTYDIDNSWHETYDLPEELTHPSMADDFYFTPTWDESTQFTDFEDTEFYKNKDDDNWDDDNNSDYDWGGSSWDSGATSWGTDW